ncbi:MAG: guanylate kinase [Bacteroidetes bacterium]|jgi:guanylate kinase|nr:guanylate kinase [Bacteroidota bacterium]MBP7256048.1 guanylate kinase [Chitinophagales bacterium]MBK7138323.1 guanylate kinase [Bacteroidota bacterium]MBK7505400.1 guanylate kinase [Bacteroidota bacterium]MBK7639339.1 guanylate kinase [Bacteroidota bacterium]
MNKAIIITGPSGAGKNTIADYLIGKFSFLNYSISATTRQPREGEVDKVDYYFITVPDFKTKIEKDEFIEWEMVYTDMFYGTLKSEINRIWAAGKAIVFVVDVIGAKDLKQYFGDSALSVFIKPPSLTELRQRIMKRRTEHIDALEERMRRAKVEIKMADVFDKILVNDDLDTVFGEADDLIADFFNKKIK